VSAPKPVQSIEERIEEDVKSFLETALRMMERYQSDRAHNMGVLMNVREQAWQAARGASELLGRVTK
jgi:hypothetical protein